jgi:hypothetical protein
MTTLTERQRVALRPAPAYDPPFDDERGSTRWLPDPPAPPATPPLRGPWSGGPDRQRPAALPVGTFEPAEPAAPAGNPSPETRTAAARFLNTCLEILNGYRPVTHLRTMSSPARATAVTEAMAMAVRRMVRGAGAPAGTRRARVRLRRMRICEPRPGVAEICAVLSTAGGGSAPEAGRCWAAAFRLERSQGQWRCTVARLL